MQQGEFPLWMPFENTGYPLLADGTSSLLYPGKAIFWLRWMSFPARYGWYLALHVLLAAGGSYSLARTLGANRWGATLAAISYAFGGSVLFQVCNVIYLISAAWLPWALRCVWKMNQPTATVVTTVGASVCCSMMIFGGDPQMVYHVGLIAAVTTMIYAGKHFRAGRADSMRRAGQLVLLIIMTTVLSAAQLLPTMEWASYSDRANTDVPMNVYDGDFSAMVNLPDRPPVSDIYQFSQEPWSIVGLLFPNVFGLDAPVNTRWTAALPGAERIWVPSNYFGCLVFLLALSGVTFYTGNRKGQGRAARAWLTWIMAWFCAASFGWYGVSWLMTECGWRFPQTEEGIFHQPVGGLYWLMVTLLPKYCLFRYPAKLMVVGCLALSVLAGVQLKPRNLKRLAWLSSASIAIGILGVTVLLLPQTIAWLKTCQSTTIFGPFQFEDSWYTILFGLLSTIGCCVLIVLLSVSMRKRSNFRSKHRRMFAALLVLTMIELTVNNRWLLHPINSANLTAPTQTEKGIENYLGRHSTQGITVSVLETDFENAQFLNHPSENRVAELAMWRREMLFPKTHLLIPEVRIWGGFTSIWPLAFDQIDRQWVSNHVDATMIGPKELGKLKFSDVRLNRPSHLKSIETSIWQGQTLKVIVEAPRGGESPKTLRLPILPLPGWVATFQTTLAGSTGSTISMGSTGSENLTARLLPDGPLHSSVVVPVSIRTMPFEVHCVYQPASFFRGLWISGAGWLIVSAIMILKWFKPYSA